MSNINVLLELIRVIKTGTPAEVKLAQKQVERLWNQSRFSSELRNDFSVLFMQETLTFGSIADADHKAYFINTIKWALWTSKIEDFPLWVNFFLTNIQNSEGKVRIATVCASEYLLCALPISFDRQESESERANARIAKDYFGQLVMCVEALIRKYHEPRFNRYKYVSALPPGVYKSLHQLLGRLLPSAHFEGIYREFCRSLEQTNGIIDFGRA